MKRAIRTLIKAVIEAAVFVGIMIVVVVPLNVLRRYHEIYR
jgi:hypothetical protein